jgi:hypothetical protein
LSLIPAQGKQDHACRPQRNDPLTMEQMSTWEMVLVGALVVLVLFWVGPGIKPMLEQSRHAENRDWAGVLIPVIVVILFVLLLIKMV